MKKKMSVMCCVLAVLLLLSLCTACQETSATEKVNVTPPLKGLEWGMTLDDVVELLDAAQPDVGYAMGDGSYPILQLDSKQLKTIGAEDLGGVPFAADYPVTLNFSDANTGTPVLITASVRLDLSGAEDAQKTMDDALNKLYGEPVMGTSRGTAGLTLKKEDCGGIREDQLNLLENHDYDAFYIYPMVTASLSSMDATVGELWYYGENYVDYMSGK